MATVAELVVVIKGDVSDLENKLNGVTGVAGKIQGVFAAAGFVALAAGIKETINRAVEFETAFTGVAKTVNGTDEQLAGVRQQIRDMAKELPASTTQIAAVAEAAGQLGIKIKDISAFTETMIKFGSSSNVSAQDAAIAFARIATVMGTAIKDVDKFASVTVALGNNFAGTEQEILNFANRLVGTGKVVGVSQQGILALSAAASAVGLEAEAGGTAFSEAFARIFTAISTGGQSLKIFAKTAGLSVDEFTRLFKVDATEALIRFSEGVTNTANEGGNFKKVLDDVGLGGIRVTDALLKMGSSSETFREAQRLANKEMVNATALNDEFAKRQETVASKIIIFKNQLNDLLITFGDKFLPVLTKVITGLIPVIAKIGDIVAALDRFDAGLKASQQVSQNFVQEVFNSFDNLKTKVTTTITNLGGSIFTRINEIQSNITSSINTAKNNVINLISGMADSAIITITRLRDLFFARFNEIKANITGPITSAKDVAIAIFGALSQFSIEKITQMRNLIFTRFNEIKANITGPISAAQNFLSSTWEAIFARAQSAWVNIRNLFFDKGNEIKNNIVNPITSMTGAISQKWSEIFSRAQSAWVNIRNLFFDKGNEIKDNIVNPITSMTGAISDKWSQIFGRAQSAWVNIRDLFFDKGNEIKNNIVNPITSMAGAISQKWSEIFSRAQSAWASIRDQLISKFNEISGAGANIFNALSGAISQAFDQVRSIVISKWETIKNAFAAGIEKVRAVLRIGSPSKVFIAIGSEVATGFTQGITRNLRGFDIPFRETISMAQGAITGAAQTTGTEINRTSNANIVQNIQTIATPEDIRRETEAALRRFAVEFPIR